MDKLENCIAALRVLARQSNDPNVQLLAERRINEYLQREIDDLRTSLRQIGRAINAEADKRVEDENWRLMGGSMFNRVVTGCLIYSGCGARANRRR